MNQNSNNMMWVVIVGVLLLAGMTYYFLTPKTVVVPVIVPVQTATTTPLVTPVATTTATTTTPVATTTPFVLSNAQKQALIAYGISSSSIPDTVTVVQEACFVAKLGVPRVIEIKAGSIPTPAELLKAKGCL